MHIDNVTIHITPPTSATAITRALMEALCGRSADAPTGDEPASAPALAPMPRIGQPWPGLDGSTYAGLARGEDGGPDMHLVLLADEPTEKLNWQAAQDWAKRIGGHLPSRDESALLYARLRDQFDASEWHWTATQYAAGYAWCQYFNYGFQYFGVKKFEARARAVRRFSA